MNPSMCVCVLLFWSLSQIYRLISTVIEAGGFATCHSSPMQTQRRERWMEHITPWAEVELGTCISPPVHPHMLPPQLPATLSPLSLLLYNHSTIQLLWLLFPVGIHSHIHTHNTCIHKSTLLYCSETVAPAEFWFWKEKLPPIQIMTGTPKTSKKRSYQT